MKEEILRKCNSSDILSRTIKKDNLVVDIIYCETLSDSSLIEKYILRPLNYTKNNFTSSLTSGTVNTVKNVKDAIEQIYLGFTIIIVDNKEILSIETKSNLDRTISESTVEGSILGSKDAFLENFNLNVGLIRKRIRNNNLKLDTIFLGSESNTKIGICYMNDLVDKKLLSKTKKRLKNIKNDIINDGAYLKVQLSNKGLFPEINSTERPDLASYALLEGKICIIIDNSPTVLIIPTFFIDFFHTADDYYEKSINATFTRILRVFAFIIAVFLPGYYISITTHNPTSIPISLLLNLITQHEFVPFPAFFEILIMTILFEILRESEIRMPSKSLGSASILGGLILGSAAVDAGIISPIMIIVVAISAIASFVFSYNSIVNIIRYYRFFILIISAFFGLFGLFIGLFILVINLSSITSFGYPYTYPIDPLIKDDLLDSVIKISKKKNKRNPLLTKKRKR